MFAVQERDRVRQRLLDIAEADPAITGAAITGSYALGGADRWSDIDLCFAIDGSLSASLDQWTARLYRDFAAVHHWDLPSGSTVYRVFLLPECLEVDLGFSPTEDFGPRGPHWRIVFGEAEAPQAEAPQAEAPQAEAPQAEAPRAAVPARHDELAGLAWHHALHARVCIERHRQWQAVHWIGALRDQVFALACLRLGHPTHYAKGAHLLPEPVTAPLEATLVRSLDEAHLRYALHAAVTALAGELEHHDEALATRLRPMLAELSAARPSSGR